MPAHTVDEDLFEDGKMFDGSSISGWKGINESDMILMPDASSALSTSFPTKPTLNLRCNVVEPATMQGYDRCPRSLAERAEAYLKSTGIADTAFFGPENEFFVFDSVAWDDNMQGAFYKVDSDEGAWNTNRSLEDGNTGHRPTVKGGYFPVPPVDSLHDIRSADVPRARGHGPDAPKCITTRLRRPASAKSASSSIPGSQGGRSADPQVRRAQRRACLRQDRDVHAQAARQRQR